MCARKQATAHDWKAAVVTLMRAVFATPCRENFPARVGIQSHLCAQTFERIAWVGDTNAPRRVQANFLPHSDMIIRTWRGWTTQSNADEYQQLLLNTIFPAIAARDIPGYLGIRLDRRRVDEEIEFVTTMLFASLEAVVAFAGETYEVAVVPPSAQGKLLHYDAVALHYEVVAGMGMLTPPALMKPAILR
jgi:hypothetical protein